MKGCILLPIFMTTTTGIVIETQAEAYVVPGMSVPILLSEDYQTAYELSVFHSVELGSRIRFGNTSFNISATGIDRSNNTAKLRKSAFSTEGFLKAKTHCRDKAHCYRHKQALLAAAQCIRAAHDARIPTHTIKPVEVDGNFNNEREWLVKKIRQILHSPQLPDFIF
jgi:hypothetical protein